MPEGAVKVKGYDFNEGNNFDNLMKSYGSMGFQATAVSQAIHEINRMIKWRLIDDPIAEDEVDEYRDIEMRKKVKCTIFLSYTSNMISCGMREIIRFLAEHHYVDCIVTTCGGIEEDIIKCLAPFYLGEFNLPGKGIFLLIFNRFKIKRY